MNHIYKKILKGIFFIMGLIINIIIFLAAYLLVANIINKGPILTDLNYEPLILIIGIFGVIIINVGFRLLEIKILNI